MAQLRSDLEALVAAKAAQGVPCGPVVGKGFLVGFRYAGDLGAFQKACRDQGLLVHRAGQDVVRLLPALNIAREELGELIGRLGMAMVE
jgi:acetylornithine/N-succinyldiaminopimelate aminotransferase